MKTILLTGFEPFGGECINPSWEIARALDGQLIGDARIVAKCLPCVFGGALTSMREALHQLKPCLVLALGQAGGRAELSLERVAVNIDDARISDNAGHKPIDEAVIEGAPVAYFSSLPIKAMAAGLREAGFPVGISQTAGTFVCNHVYFGLQHYLRDSPVRSGFMHIPLLPEQAAKFPGQASMALATMVDGVRVALNIALHSGADLRESGGTIC
ncbi:pyroglutamyl-peptidase I [Roseateles oligotrophus]|uniref:Pyrrolidone-carboxylate peptidase n=1 Tax=Roseateles oligotrophus TaxID=1769250 RepID=A0ABT2YFH4_9BURK|nr:pyroglutamyl-peptidase I [Roseateles oligotrophus]MCV2368801.1 pyroglutamyl-peptidase I [Roseateles oligotrophus]